MSGISSGNNQPIHNIPLSLKYSNQLKMTKDFKKTCLVQLNIIGFRYVHSLPPNQTSFLPQAITDPDKGLKSGGTIKDICSGYGLSMFTSLTNLRQRAKDLQNSYPNILKRLGSFYAELNLTVNDGACTHPDLKGHFDFHETTMFNPIPAIKSTGTV